MEIQIMRRNMKADQMLTQISEQGYVCVENFVPQEKLKAFMPEVYKRFERQSFNGTVGHIQVGNQKYLQWTLSVHPEILRLYLHPSILECCERYIGTPVHLQDYRIYQNQPGLKMAWHVDNKQTNEDLTSSMLSNQGLIAIIYLEEVKQGPFQFVAKSHQWAWKDSREVWEDQALSFEKDIVTFNNKPAGTLILYDFRGIHRAQPYFSGPPRTAFFAQYAGIEWPAGEPIFLETSSLKNLTAKEQQVLRFGRVPSAPTWPIPIDADQKPLVDIPTIAKSYAKNFFQKMVVSQK
jgi:ectoine hydroxylase-related dioxygenase (phytanoyl-CoA dioxygenase family)